ncbi:DUF4097 family beta strand repeat-containing protein [Neobacillus ginsengisoli]|uniref:DUF4097 and DUF4098 domain-containing protein YvlB n=1 Tax=Neobacillus ginsengisoli TaxID=904295 RepID=A0ABT9Y0V4_9BACI|nr:DUF4097 family beta strand repeat-containing protein [Neobacillus ginsengisoli]MDQ0200759.1 DUF4097 and DUF4098 domain-containing protein YvlB [Neobacillus ginsengisoli]
MKKLSIVAALFGLVIGVIGVFYYGFAHPASSVTVNETKTIQVKDINKINLESRSSSVHFYPSASDVLTVHLHGKTSRKDLVFSVSKSGDTALIDIGPKNDHVFHLSLFEFMNNNLQADVEVPQKMYSELTGHSQAGSIDIRQLSAGRMDLDSSAGSIKGEDLKGDVTAHSSAGSIKLTNIEGKMDLSSSAGSVDVEVKAITQDITAHSSAGSVRIVTGKQPESLQLNLQTSAGSVNVNLANVSYSTKEHDRVLGSIGSGGPKLQLESSAGSVSINKK